MKTRTPLLLLLTTLTLAFVGCENRADKPEGTSQPQPTAKPQAEATATAPRSDSPLADYVATTELASVDESAIEYTIYVRQDAANPTGADGSQARPFTRIIDAQPALTKALTEGTPTRLLIGPGTYREDVRYLIGNKGKTNPTFKATPLVIEGEAAGEVIISGSITHNADYDFRPNTWKAVDGEPGLYVHEWPFEGHLEPGPWMDSYGFALLPGLMQRSESIWFHGKHLRQVLVERYDWQDPDGKRGYADQGTGKGGDADNKPGQLVFAELLYNDPAKALDEAWTFCVFTDENSPETLQGKIFVRVPEGKWPSDPEAIEVGLWKKSYAPLLIVRNKDNFVLRNLSIRHGVMGPLSSALAINNATNFIVENVDASENSSGGIVVNQSRQGHFKNVSANENGSAGIGSGGSRHILYEDCETNFNNFRGAWAGWLAWHQSGFKSGGVHNITMRRFTAIGNYANGLWYDVYCTNILVEDSFLLGNRRMGLMFELTKPKGGPHIARNSVFAYNDNCGVYLSMASNSGLVDSILVGNGNSGDNSSNVESEVKNTQLLYKFRDHPQGPNSSEAWQSVIVRNNIMASADPSASMVDYIFRKADPATQYARVLEILDSDENTYWQPTPGRAFRAPSGGWLDLDGWRELLDQNNPDAGNDHASSWSNPGMDDDPRIAFTKASQSAVTQKARAMGVPLRQDAILDYWQRVDKGLYDEPNLFIERQHD
jgi:hypothetical protein